MKEVILRENLTFQAHSILAGGLLTGRYKVSNADYVGEGGFQIKTPNQLKENFRRLSNT